MTLPEPLTFHDHAFIAIASQFARSIKGKKGGERTIECDVQAAYDIATAMTKWRKDNTKKDE